MLGFRLRTPFQRWIAENRTSSKACRLHHESTSKTLIPRFSSSIISVHIVDSFTTLAAAEKSTPKVTPNDSSLIDLFKSYGLTNTDIATLAKKSFDFNRHSDKCIRPKLEFFVAAGFSGTVLAKIISRNPLILRASLERRLTPNLHLLMTILSGNREAAAASIVNSAQTLLVNADNSISPNLDTLRKHGVNDANVARLFAWCPRAILHEPGKFSRSVSLIKEMGFDPTKSMFILGLHVVTGLTQPTWERKLKLYGSFGLSLEETMSAFKKHPNCMLCSDEKITKVIGFFEKNLNWKPSRLAALPCLFTLSLEKRIVPRYAVFSILERRGFLANNKSFSSVLYLSVNDFLNKFVYKYSDEIPELLDVFKVKTDMVEFKVEL